jgi:hypothetical protein
MVHDFFSNEFHAHTAQLCSCAETHEVARRAAPSLCSFVSRAFAQRPPASAFMAYTPPFKRLLRERLAGGAPPSSPTRSTAVATEAEGTPAALLALALFDSGPVGAAAKQGVHQEFGGRDNPTDGASHAARGVKGLATRAARAAHAGPRAAAKKTASPAVHTCSLPRKAALRSGAATAAMMTAHVFCRCVSQAFLAILEPERQRWADSGVR